MYESYFILQSVGIFTHLLMNVETIHQTNLILFAYKNNASSFLLTEYSFFISLTTLLYLLIERIFIL